MLEKIKNHKIIVLLFFILFLFIINNNVNAATCNVDTSSYTSEQLDYIRTCYTNVMADFNTNNYTASYYFICSIDGVTVEFNGSGKQFIIAFVERSHSNIVNPNYSNVLCLYNTGLIRYYNFKDGNTNWSSTGTFSTNGYTYKSLKVYYTNYSNQYCSKNDFIIEEPYFNLEYNENLNSYVVYSKWYCVADFEFKGMNQHYYQNNPVNPPYSFSDALRKTEGWFNMQGVENEIGPGTEYNDEINKEEEDIDINNLYWRVGLQIIDYGTYYFCHYMPMEETYDIMRFVISENGNSYTETLDKNNYNNWIHKTIIDNNTNTDLQENINTQNSYNYFRVFYTEGYENAFIYTNWFLSDSSYSYVVDYSLDNVTWNEDMNIEEYTSNYDYFRYTLDVFKNSPYYIRLRIYDTENENNLVSTKIVQLKIRAIGQIEYNGTDTDVEYMIKNNTFYKFFSNNLGPLFFPVELMFKFYSRLDCIGKANPSITVPTIHEYFTGSVIINGFTYSLDSVLENETFANVYTIYLNFVDFILFVALSCYLYKVFKEFVNFGGGIL